jgi:hypothetical protein
MVTDSADLPGPQDDPYSPYADFSREQWARLRAATPLTLTDTDLAQLRGLSEVISLDEVRDVYLPLSRFLNLYVGAAQNLNVVADLFLGTPARHVPFVIGLGGSVAVGKSTTARILQALLARWPNHPKVDLVTTPRPTCDRGTCSTARAFPRPTISAGCSASWQPSRGARRRCWRPSTPTSSMTSSPASTRSCANPTS